MSTMRKTILSISPSQALLTTRQMLLEREGYAVVSCANFREMELACTDCRFDLGIIGHSLEANTKRALAARIRDLSPGTPILEMCHISPEITDAEFITSDNPTELIRHVREILGDLALSAKSAD
jgi:DNA-binding NtrC family response regulator